jgi:hypothetical protein
VAFIYLHAAFDKLRRNLRCLYLHVLDDADARVAVDEKMLAWELVLAPHIYTNACEKQTPSDSQLSFLCLSRACLGKLISFLKSR